MEAGFDLLAGLKGKVTDGRDSCAPSVSAPDWHALHARLSAGHAAQGALAAAGTPVGSFVTGLLSKKRESFRRVNLTDSTDRKYPAGNEGPVAGESVSGGRGL